MRFDVAEFDALLGALKSVADPMPEPSPSWVHLGSRLFWTRFSGVDLKELLAEIRSGQYPVAQVVGRVGLAQFFVPVDAIARLRQQRRIQFAKRPIDQAGLFDADPA